MRGRSSPGGGLVVSFSIIVFGSLVRGGIFAGVGFPFKEVLARLAALRTNEEAGPSAAAAKPIGRHKISTTTAVSIAIDGICILEKEVYCCVKLSLQLYSHSIQIYSLTCQNIPEMERFRIVPSLRLRPSSIEAMRRRDTR